MGFHFADDRRYLRLFRRCEQEMNIFVVKIFCPQPFMLTVIITAFNSLAVFSERFNIVSFLCFDHVFDCCTACCFFIFEDRTAVHRITVTVGSIIHFYGAAFFLSDHACFKKTLSGSAKDITAVPHIICGAVNAVVDQFFIDALCHKPLHINSPLLLMF